MTDKSAPTTVIALCDPAVTHTDTTININNTPVTFDAIYNTPDITKANPLIKSIDSLTDGYNHTISLYTTAPPSHATHTGVINTCVRALFAKIEQTAARKQTTSQYLITVKAYDLHYTHPTDTDVYELTDLMVPSTVDRPVDVVHPHSDDAGVRLMQLSEIVAYTETELTTYIAQSLRISTELHQRYVTVSSGKAAQPNVPAVFVDVCVSNKQDDTTALVKHSVLRIALLDATHSAVQQLATQTNVSENVHDEPVLYKLIRHSNAYSMHIYDIAPTTVAAVPTIVTMVQTSRAVKSPVQLQKNAMNYTIGELRQEIKTVKNELNLAGSAVNMKLVQKLKYLLSELDTAKRQTFESKKQRSAEFVQRRNGAIEAECLLDCVATPLADGAVQQMTQQNKPLLKQIVGKLNEIDAAGGAGEAVKKLNGELSKLGEQYRDALSKQMTAENRAGALNTLSTDTMTQQVYAQRLTRAALDKQFSSDAEKLDFVLERYTEQQYRAQCQLQRYTEHMMILFKTYRLQHEKRVGAIETKYRELLHNSINDCLKVNDQYTKLKLQVSQKQRLI